MPATVRLGCDGPACADEGSYVEWADGGGNEIDVTTRVHGASRFTGAHGHGTELRLDTGWLLAEGWTVHEVNISGRYPQGLRFLCRACSSARSSAIKAAAHMSSQRITGVPGGKGAPAEDQIRLSDLRRAAADVALEDDTHPVHGLHDALRAAARDNRVLTPAELYEAAYAAGWVVTE